MNKTKEVLVVSFALFSLFFGAGNLILPPYLGFNSGNNWFLVTLGFAITAVLIPILGILANAKLQGTMYDFGKKVSPLFSSLYCLIMYMIAISLPGPRTASVTHELAIAPYFNVSSLTTSTIYFILVFIFVINRSKILDLVGKFLTPIIVLILLIIIGICVFTSPDSISNYELASPLVDGILEGYQTFDAIGAVVVGAVVIISLNLKGYDLDTKKSLLVKAGWIAGIGLLVIYAGLIMTGSLFNGAFDKTITRSVLLSGLSLHALGSFGQMFMSILVALACFTTAVGIVTGTADYFKGLFHQSQMAYTITAVLGCVIGILVGSYNVAFIIDTALPALMFIYPITIVLILLNVVPDQWASSLVFKVVVGLTFLFSIPDFLKFIVSPEKLEGTFDFIPFSNNSLGWVLPALIGFILVNLFHEKKPQMLKNT